jgi:hypothetical protein
MKDNLDLTTWQKLVRLGTIADSEAASQSDLLNDLKLHGHYLRSKDPDLSFQFLLHIGWRDACALVRGLVIAENAELSVLRGSVSLVKYAYRMLEFMNPEGAMEVASWIVDHSNNDYIPFEMRKTRRAFVRIRESARTWEQCREQLERWKTEEWETRKLALAALHQQEERHRILEAIRKKCAAEKHTIQLARSAARQLFIEALAQVNEQERLEHLAWDDSHGLGYYPSGMAQCSATALASLTEQTKARLIQKLKARRKGPWKKLYLFLVELNKPYNPNH